MPVQLQPVDDAVNIIKMVLKDTFESKDGWSFFSIEDSDCELTYADRNGVVAGSGDRAANERPKRAETTDIRFRMKVQPRMTNQFGTMHGGCAASIIDTLSSFIIPLYSTGDVGQPWITFGMSQTLTVNYLAPTRLGSWIEVAVKGMSVGKSVALLETEIWELSGDKSSDRKVRTAFSTHTKIDVSGKLAKI